MDRDQLYNDPEESFRISFAGGQSDMWTAMPGIVQSVDWTEMTCTVQPAIQGTITDQNGIVTAINLPLLIHVPIVFPQAGGFTMTLPLTQGDEVLVVWACRCIDAWWQSGGIQIPMEARMHDLSDGFAIPGPVSKPNVISSISTTNAQLRTNDGTTYLEITPGGGINIVSPDGFSVTGDMQVSGDLNVTGTITGGAVKEGLIELGTHKHSGVTTGTGSSGGPIP